MKAFEHGTTSNEWLSDLAVFDTFDSREEITFSLAENEMKE